MKMKCLQGALFMTLTFALCGCRAPENPASGPGPSQAAAEPGGGHRSPKHEWLDDARVELTLERQQRTHGIETRAEQFRQMRELRDQADVVLEQVGLDRLRLVRSTVPNKFPNRTFRPSEIPGSILGGSGPAKLVVTLVPYVGGNLDLVRATDKALLLAKVKRRVYQINGPSDFAQLDSAAP